MSFETNLSNEAESKSDKEQEREAFVKEQQLRADSRNQLEKPWEKWQNKYDYTDIAKEEAEKMDELAKEKVEAGEATSWTEAIEQLMHLEDFQLKNENKIISEENWKALPVETIYRKAENAKSEVPVTLAPGWACSGSGTFKESIEILNGLGRDVVSFDSTRAMEILATEDDKHPAVEIQKAMAILRSLEAKGIEKTDLLVHSEGGINGLIAASMQPEKFRKIILAMPAGTIGQDSFWSLVGRFSKEMIGGAINLLKDPKRFKPTNIYLADFITYIAKNPALAFKEVLAISKSDTSEMLKTLREQGIEIKIIAGSNDPVFTPQRIKENLSPDCYDDMLVEKGSHGELFMKAENFMGIVDAAIGADAAV